MDNILIPILSLDLQKAQQTEEEIVTHRGAVGIQPIVSSFLIPVYHEHFKAPFIASF